MKSARQHKILSVTHVFKRIHSMMLLLAMTALASACSSGGGSGDSTVRPTETSDILLVEQPALEWSTCDFTFTLECADLLVPMDYRDPAGETISVALARIPIQGTENIRTVLTNPGGPGGSGLGFLRGFARDGEFSQRVRDGIQFVSFDPRGLGRSTPIACDPRPLLDQDIYATTFSDIQTNVIAQSAFAEACFARHGNYLLQLGSNNVVKDMNEIRKALGQPTLDFLGYSYGTRLAGLFLQAYPSKSGRMVLDASMTPDPNIIPLIRGGLQASQVNIDKMIATCSAVFVGCDPNEVSDRLLLRLDRLGNGDPTEEFAILLFYVSLASKTPGFEELFVEGLVNYLISGNEQDLLNVLERFISSSQDNDEFSGINSTVYSAVLCADEDDRPTANSLEGLRGVLNSDSDALAESIFRTIGICAGWPATVDPIPTISTNQAPVSLVIGGPNDAQTPLIFAQQMATAVGGHFLHSVHDGHTVSFRGANACTDSAVSAFLLDGIVPTVSLCEDDNSVIIADPWVAVAQTPFALELPTRQ